MLYFPVRLKLIGLPYFAKLTVDKMLEPGQTKSKKPPSWRTTVGQNIDPKAEKQVHKQDDADKDL